MVELQADNLFVQILDPSLEFRHGEHAGAVAAEEGGTAAGAFDGAFNLEARAELLVVVAGGLALEWGRWKR